MSEKIEKKIEFCNTFRELCISKNFVSLNYSASDKNDKLFLPYKRKNLLNLTDFYERLMKIVSIKGTVLPRNCRYIDSSDSGFKILVIEDPPAVRNIYVDMDFENSKERFKITGKDKVISVKNLIGDKRPYRLNLSFPYVVYMIMFNSENRFSKMKIFQGNWRLPIVIGLFFALAHFWTPFHIPGTRIPLQVIGTFPAGFLAAWYFLRFRNILPLTLSHVIFYVLLHNWVQVYM